MEDKAEAVIGHVAIELLLAVSILMPVPSTSTHHGYEYCIMLIKHEQLFF